MKYIIGLASILFFVGCSTTREFPEDRYQPVYQQPYGVYSDPYYSPAYDYNYRDRVIYDNNYYGGYHNRRHYYRYDDRQPQVIYRDRQPQYRVVEPRVQQQQQQIIQPRVVQPRDIRYPDGTIKKADGQIIHPNERVKN